MKVRAYEEFSTNVKGLPYDPGQPGSNRYLTETGYSQTYPWKVVSVSASGKTMQIVPVNVERDPEWKPEIIPGGFVGHCTNQNEQTWLYDGVGENVRTVRLKKSPYYGSDLMWGDANGGQYIANGARYLYDYNF